MSESFKSIKDFNGVYIPADIRFRCDMSWSEKIYISLVMMGYDEKAADELFNMPKKYASMHKIKKNLRDLGFTIPKGSITADRAKELTIEKSHKGKKCEWCGKECHVLQKHHFPIPAHNGGNETVNICPNCHYTYHSIMGM